MGLISRLGSLHRRLRRTLGFTVALALAALPAPAADRKTAPTTPDLSPTLRIPVDKLGYLPPGQILLLFRVPSSTLNFIDDKHLLLTFHAGGLLKRMPDEPEDDQDQVIHAVVIDLSRGKEADGKDAEPGRVTAEADWRMHDRSRYLWQLENGRFLVRSRNTLYEIDRGLHFTPYLRTGAELAGVDLSADRSLLLVSSVSREKDEGLQPSSMLGAMPAEDKRSYELSIIRTADDKVAFHTTTPVNIHPALVADGYVDVKQEDIASNRASWVVSYKPFQGEPKAFAKVLSSCRPRPDALSRDAVLVTSCTRDSDDHLEQAFTLDGRTLWQQRWSARYAWPTIERSENGSRFAVGSIELTHSIGVLDPMDETLMRRQLVGVYDTATGQLRLVRDATPMLTAGQNFALSANGQRFAILRDGAIEVYDLPPAAID